MTRSHSGAFSSFGVVYANDLAKSQIANEKPNYPVGSIIIREKFLTEELVAPEVVIAMVKRQPGFSKNTGDWEFFVFDGKEMALNKRETKGSCADCHLAVKDADWVFRDYVK